MTDTFLEQGVTLSWVSAAGDETLTLTSLGDAAARQGDEHDFGALFAPMVRVEIETVLAVAPTVGEPINVYWASSQDGTDYDGEMGAADAAVGDLNQLLRCYLVGVLPVDDDTSLIRGSWIFPLPARYGLPIVENQSGQALSAVAADHHIKVTPINPDNA